MLILTRKEGETILVGEDIEITFLGLRKINPEKNSKKKFVLEAKLGFEAPRNINIVRKELKQKN